MEIANTFNSLQPIYKKITKTERRKRFAKIRKVLEGK